ncbi:MAG: threonine/serine exporter family protein [Eubacterium sp.]|nr:threonine/serine exporter family protein [Eubacterium sp.]
MLDITTCILGTFGFSVLLKVSKQKLIYTVLGGAISASLSYLLLQKGFGVFTATFFAMVAICIYSEALARIIKTPANIILLPSTIPLLPGGSLYYTLSYLLHSDRKNFLIYAKETILVGAGIALGAVFISIIITFIMDSKRWVNDAYHH